jgi:hypothetical protein
MGASCTRFALAAASIYTKNITAYSRFEPREPHLLSSAGGMLMLSPGLRRLFHRPYAGLAAARMVVRVLSVVVMPALAMLTVCCSITCAASNLQG